LLDVSNSRYEREKQDGRKMELRVSRRLQVVTSEYSVISNLGSTLYPNLNIYTKGYRAGSCTQTSRV